MNAIRNWDGVYTRDKSLYYNNVISVDIIEDVETEPLSLANAKAHLKVDFSDEDTYITQLIKEAREQIEDEINMALAPKTLKAELRNERGYIRLPYWSGAGTIVELTDFEGEVEDPNNYTINDGVLETGFSTTVYVEYETGFGTIPHKYLRMIKERLAFLYNSRGDEEKTNNNGVWLA